MMLSSTSSTNVAGDTEPALEIPILMHKARQENIDSSIPTIVRDFAYAADNPLFWRIDDSSDDEDSVCEHPEPWSEETGHSDVLGSEGSGFTGAPPWLQSASQEGLMTEEDMLASTPDDDLHGKAIALFDFAPEHENEFALHEGQIIYISSRHGLGWLVAVDLSNGDCGLVPEEYVRLMADDEDVFDDANTTIDHDGMASHQETMQYATSEELHHAKQNEDLGMWVDEPSATRITTPNDNTASHHEPQEMTDEERQKIMDAAEREMALVDAQLREA